MAELADALDLGSSGLPVQVQVLSSALEEILKLCEERASGFFLFGHYNILVIENILSIIILTINII